MVVLVGPKTVAFSRVSCNSSGRTNGETSRVWVVRPCGEKRVRCSAGIGRRRVANGRLQVKLNGGLWNSRQGAPVRRALSSLLQNVLCCGGWLWALLTNLSSSCPP